MRKKIVAGNWKMNLDLDQTTTLINEIKMNLDEEIKGVEIIVCPPFTSLVTGRELLQGSFISLGAQNMSQHSEGAYTGEVSGKMLKSAGCKYVILGHSERRHFFLENDTLINAKLKAALKENLIPIVCIGETEAEREAGHTYAVVTRQINGVLHTLSSEVLKNVIIAYEPVWAIGTGKNATPEQANEIHHLIRELLCKNYDRSIADSVHILYGGSVNANNALSIFLQPEIDGGLIGGASLKSDSFCAIVRAAASAIKNKQN